VGCGDLCVDRHRGHDRRAGGALLHESRTEGGRGSDTFGERHPKRVPEPLGISEPDSLTGQEPDSEAHEEPDSVAGHDPDPGADSDAMPGHEPEPEPKCVAGQEPEPVAERLDSHLPEEPVAVRLDDVRQRHRHLPVGRAVCADPHLDDV
jgi:hypothetical protein